VTSDQINNIIRGIGEFPTLPAVVARVIQELNNPYSSAANLTDIISVDQAMTFRILKMANSAYYGFPRTIATVTESIVLLGFSTVRNLMLTTMMYSFNEMTTGRGRRGRPAFEFDHQEEWKHSLAAAIAARELMLQRRQEASEHLGYLAGLMHDIGKKLFYHYLPKEYADVLSRKAKDGEELSRMEQKLMGTHHGQVGAWIVDQWKLPQEIVEPIALHHFPGEAKEQKELAAVVYAANKLARVARQDAAGRAAWLKVPSQTWTGLELTPEQIGKLWAVIGHEIRQIEAFMSV